eukprot:COSAG02_NODE_379_length_23528_cov_140.781510_11_plen_82_part_00
MPCIITRTWENCWLNGDENGGFCQRQTTHDDHVVGAQVARDCIQQSGRDSSHNPQRVPSRGPELQNGPDLDCSVKAGHVGR